jgi:CHRD domain
VRRRLQLTALVAVVAVLGVVGAAVATGGGRNISERLEGFQEVPAVSTGASGKFDARIGRFDDEIRFRLSYRDLEGPVTQAHIHLGQERVAGGISVWLCGNPSATVNPPAGTQLCPPSPATIEGTIEPDDVVGPSGQGIDPGEFDELLDAIDAGVTYANVHSTRFPAGEIRGQLDDRRHGH